MKSTGMVNGLAFFRCTSDQIYGYPTLLTQPSLSKLISLLLCFFVGLLAYSGELSARTTSEKLIVELNPAALTAWEQQPQFVMLSPDQKRIAYISRADDNWDLKNFWRGKKFVILDGKRQQEYDSIFLQAFSPDSRHFAFLGATISRNLPQPRSDLFLVVDGIEQPYLTQRPENFRFSLDSRHTIYQTNSFGDRQAVVVDNQMGTTYGRIGEFALSPDGKRVAYAAQEKDQMFVVVDGKESEHFHAEPLTAQKGTYHIPIGPISFSPDGRRLFYVVTQAQKGKIKEQFLVLDGVRGESQQRITDAQFSPDGHHFGYVARSDRSYAIVDGAKSKGYYDIKDFQFSPDSKQFVYIATTGINARDESISKKSSIAEIADDNEDENHGESTPVAQTVVVNGKEGRLYREVSLLRFSANGQHLIYRAASLSDAVQEYIIVLDGVEKSMSDVFNLAISPDGKSVAYHIMDEPKSYVSFGDQAGQPYDAIGWMAFSPDGRHLCYLAEDNNNWYMVVDGIRGKAHTKILGTPVFAGTLNFIARRENKLYSITEQLD